MNFTTATPAEIDQLLAETSLARLRAIQTASYNVDRIMDMAEMREYVRPTERYGKGHYILTGTFEAGRARIESACKALDAHYATGTGRYEDMTAEMKLVISGRDYATRYLAAFDAATEEIAKADGIIHDINAEWFRRDGWTRKWLVVSSSGHLHAHTECSTCNNGKQRTAFALWYQLSGLTEAEAITALETRADALCSVCYPTAPVAAKRTNVTKAQARKITGYDLD